MEQLNECEPVSLAVFCFISGFVLGWTLCAVGLWWSIKYGWKLPWKQD